MELDLNFPIVLGNFWRLEQLSLRSSNLEQILPFCATFEQNIDLEQSTYHARKSQRFHRKLQFFKFYFEPFF